MAGSVITLLATPFVIRESSRVASWVSGVAEGEPAADSEAVSDHVVIIGFGIAGRSIARILKTLEIPYRAVDSNPHSAEAWREQGEPIVFGDATRPSILEHVGVQRARLVSIAINDPEATLGAIVVTRALAPDVPIIARARYVEQLDGLYAAGASQVVAEEFESAIDLVSKVLRGFDISQPAIAQFALQLREEGYELLRGPLALPIDPWLADVLEEVGADWIEVPQEDPAQSLHRRARRSRAHRREHPRGAPPWNGPLEPAAGLLRRPGRRAAGPGFGASGLRAAGAARRNARRWSRRRVLARHESPTAVAHLRALERQIGARLLEGQVASAAAGFLRRPRYGST